MGRNIVKNISKNVSSKCNNNLISHVKQYATGALRTYLKKAIQKTAEAAGELTRNKIADKITKIWETSSQSNSETVKIYIS